MVKIFLILISMTICGSAKASPAWTLDLAQKVKEVRQVLVSPDGEQAVYEVFDYKNLEIYQVQLKNPKKNQLILKGPDISQSAWSSDGLSLFYIAAGKSGKKLNSIYKYDFSQGSSKLYLELEHDIQSFKQSPDGEKFALILSKKKSRSSLKIIEKNILWLCDKSKICRSLTAEDIDVRGDYSWFPDSRKLIYSYQIKGQTGDFHTYFLSQLDLNAPEKGPSTYVLSKGVYVRPMVSPDGQKISILSDFQLRSQAVSNKLPFISFAINSQVCILSATQLSTPPKCFSATPSDAAWTLGWASDSKSIYAHSFVRTTSRIYQISLDDRQLALTPEEESVSYLAQLNSKASFLGYAKQSFYAAPEAAVMNLKAGTFQTISNNAELINEEQNDLRRQIRAESIHWKSKDGTPIEGILISPLSTPPGEKLPLIVALHGGPTYLWTQSFLGGILDQGIPFCPASLATKGYAILEPNVRGSMGYGFLFRNSNYQDFGGKDYQDVLSGVSQLVEKGVVDSKRVGVWGWSYGGYLAAWALTQSSIWKTGIVGAGITNFFSFFAHSDLPDFLRSYFGGTPQNQHSLWISKSPLFQVTKIKAPILIQHGEVDRRVPLGQSQELYRKLKSLKIPASLKVYKNQGHLFSKIETLRVASDEMEEWFQNNL